MFADKSHRPRHFGKVAVEGGIWLAEDIKLTSTKKERFAYFVARDKVRAKRLERYHGRYIIETLS